MSIISQQITANSLQVSGKRRVSYEYTDHIGSIYTLLALEIDAVTDVDVDMLSRIPAIEVGLEEAETNGFIGDPLTATFNHTTKKKVIRRLLVEAMKDENPKALLKLDAVIVWVRANYTGAQIADYLNITISQAQKIANRYDALKLIQTELDADVVEVIE